MDQYQILARKLLGPPGTGPKQTLEVKNSVATPPRVRQTAAACTACGTLPHATRGTSDHRHCSCVQLQCCRAHATIVTLLASRRLDPTSFARKPALQTVGGGRSSNQVHRPDSIFLRQSALEDLTDLPRTESPRKTDRNNTCVTLNGSGIQLAVGPQPLRLRNHDFELAQRIMVKRLATSRHDPLGITDSASKNQLVVVSVQYGPFNPYIPIRSNVIGKSRVAIDPIAMHTSWRSNSDIASVTRVSMTFRVVRTNQYNQDLGLIHSTNGNHLESPNEGSSIDHQQSGEKLEISRYIVVSAGYPVERTMRHRFDYGTGNVDTMPFRLMLRNQLLE
ncbi:callose synthase 12-like [Dorcoceras hygrometricum]|uniref:Callose synthase 12-like n=1 Tax=Dorcoceras hygrometricum TaxID=472368 RepID=A0A2Z7BRL1_9LAMI|nr:callose synthase 12-like [Dorcoceras hygrometricum]